MEHWKKIRFVKEFLMLPDQKQQEVLKLMREFEKARTKSKLYHNQRPINRTQMRF